MLMKGFIKKISVCGLDSWEFLCGLKAESYGQDSESSTPREDVECFHQLKEFGLSNGSFLHEIILHGLLIVYCENALVCL